MAEDTPIGKILTKTFIEAPDGCLLCQDGVLLHANIGMHELPEPFGMMPCQKHDAQKYEQLREIEEKGIDPMNYTRAVTEQELTEKAVGPRVTDEQVEAFIRSEHYFTAFDGVVGACSDPARPLLVAQGQPSTLKLLTFCVLVLENGFTVHGFSACADPKNFDPAIGRRIARANAKAHVWGLLGFQLRTELDLMERSWKKATTEEVPENTQ